MPKVRLGVALLVPPPVADEIDGLRRALGDRSLGRVPPHITLVPPVNVREEHVGQALAVVRAAAAATAAEVTVTLGPPTSFLPANPVLYLPVGGDVATVEALRAGVWAPPLTRPLTWPFVPHVTLVDAGAGAPPAGASTAGASTAAASEWIEAAVAALGGYQVDVAFDRIHLLVERRPGRQWVPLADVAFGAPAIVARGGPLAVELVRSHSIDPEARALLDAEGIELDESGDGVVVTARREGEVVGVGRAWGSPDGCQATVVVATRHRHQGIGRHIDAALESATAEARWGGRYPRTRGSEGPRA